MPTTRSNDAKSWMMSGWLVRRERIAAPSTEHNGPNGLSFYLACIDFTDHGRMFAEAVEKSIDTGHKPAASLLHSAVVQRRGKADMTDVRF